MLEFNGGRAARPVALMLILFACAGCATGTYDGRFYYEPRPADVGVRFLDHPDREAARSLIVVRGVRRGSEETGEGPGVEVLWQVSNRGDEPITMRADALRLTAANLESFPPPRLEPTGDVEVSGRGATTVRAVFPFPGGVYPGAFDLSGLSVQWTVESGGQSVSDSATFHRRAVAYRSSYYWPHYGYHGHYSHYRWGLWGRYCD